MWRSMALHVPREHSAFVVARHATHGYLLLLKGAGCAGKKQFELPVGRFAHSEVKGASYYTAKAAAIGGLLLQTGLDFRRTPERLQRMRFPVQIQEKMGNCCFFELVLHDADSLCDGDVQSSSLSGGLSFLLSISEEHFGFTFQRDLQNAAAALATSHKRVCMALLATRSMYSQQNCCFTGLWSVLGGHPWWGQQKVTAAKTRSFTFGPASVWLL